jgi:cytochrome P450
MAAPVLDVSLDDLVADPYPTYRMLREHHPVAWVPEAGRYLVTRHDDIVGVERDPKVFSSAEAPSNLTRVMGETLLRKDGEAHRRERVAAERPLRPRIVTQHWQPVFRRNAEELIGGFADRGAADLAAEFAGPLAARNLAALLGLRGVAPADLQVWSQALIDGSGNYGDDPAVWERCEHAVAGIDAAVEEAVGFLRESPDDSIISSMLHADDPLSYEQILANVKVVIGGGLNEPRDAIGIATYALLTHPEQRAAVESDPALWKRVFEEAIRWVSPIGMYPRQVTEPVVLGGVPLEPGDRIGVVVASGNRDQRVYSASDEFDIHRPETGHIAFGGGPHFCLGTWAARLSVGQIAVPLLFSRLRGLRLAPADPARFRGWVFRGPLELPVVWDA